MSSSDHPKTSLGSILSGCGIITQENIEAALEEQKKTGARLGEALIQLGIVTQEDIDWALSHQLDIPYIRLKAEMIDPEAVKLVPAETARKFNLIPLIVSGEELSIAIADPLNRVAIAAVEDHCGCEVNVSVALIREIREMIDICYGAIEDKRLGFTSPAFSPRIIETINGDLSGKSLLQYLLLFMVQNRLTSLSLQPLRDHVAIVGSRAGITQPAGLLTYDYYPDIARRIRKSASISTKEGALSGTLTIENRTTPQYFRVDIMPAYGGDFVTIKPHRLFTAPRQLADLHLSTGQEDELRRLAKNRSGVVVFASENPADRNMFMTIMLDLVATQGKNVFILGEGDEKSSTLFPRIPLHNDDPHSAAVISAILAHAPDILLIEDATESPLFLASCRAAMKGVLVLAGVESFGTLPLLRRLQRYREENSQLSSSISGIVSFRAVQILCSECKKEFTPSAAELAALTTASPPDRYYRSVGCQACDQSGFSGRKFLADILILPQESGVPHNLTGGVEGNLSLLQEAHQLLLAGKIAPDDYIDLAGGETWLA